MCLCTIIRFRHSNQYDRSTLFWYYVWRWSNHYAYYTSGGMYKISHIYANRGMQMRRDYWRSWTLTACPELCAMHNIILQMYIIRKCYALNSGGSHVVEIYAESGVGTIVQPRCGQKKKNECRNEVEYDYNFSCVYTAKTICDLVHMVGILL